MSVHGAGPRRPTPTQAAAPAGVPVVIPDERRGDFASRMRLARMSDPREAARRSATGLRVVAVTLLWAVSVSLLLGLGVADGGHLGEASPAFALAAAVAVVLPFVAAVIATRSGLTWLGGAYVVLTLVMVFPAIGVLGLG